jgi:hypothetical protein
MMDRRSLLRGLVAAPAVILTNHLMPVKLVDLRARGVLLSPGVYVRAVDVSYRFVNPNGQPVGPELHDAMVRQFEASRRSRLEARWMEVN